VGQLESLQEIAWLDLSSEYVYDRIDYLSSLGVVPDPKIIARTTFSVNKIVWIKKCPICRGSNRIDGSALQISEDGSCEMPTLCVFIEVYIRSLELKIWLTFVLTQGVDSVLFGDVLPECFSDLIAALSYMHRQYLSHSY